MSLERFKTAQASSLDGFATALAEMQAGEKRSHWIWYLFPQLVGLGRSSTAQFYGLQGIAEARAYLQDQTLALRLHTLTSAVAARLTQGTRLVILMGGTTDALKLVSSLTLFELLAAEAGNPTFSAVCAEVLAVAEREGFPRCQFTLAALAGR